MFEASGRFLDRIASGCLTVILSIFMLCLAVSAVIACPMLIVILLLLGILCKMDDK